MCESCPGLFMIQVVGLETKKPINLHSTLTAKIISPRHEYMQDVFKLNGSKSI
jgi:hypothetical protein